jgi:hypothetical protein
MGKQKQIFEKIIQESIVDSMSFPTKLAQLMGYLPLTFDRRTNTLKFSYYSVPFFVFLFHLAFSFCWSAFYFTNMTGFRDIMHNNKPQNSFTLTLTYLGSLIISTISSSIIRVICFSKRENIMEFYRQFTRIIMHLAIPTEMQLLADDIQSSIKVTKFRERLQDAKKEMHPIWVFTTVALAASFISSSFITVWIQFQAESSVHSTLWWKLYGNLGIFFSNIVSILYSAMLIWLARLVICIRIAFRCLQDEIERDLQRLKSYDIALTEPQLVYCNLQSKLNYSYTRTVEYFISNYMSLRENVKKLNEIFAYPIMINLAGLCFYWILHSFAGIASFVNKDVVEIILTELIVSTFVWICLVNFWCICNSSQKLNDQVESYFPAVLKEVLHVF